MTNLSSGDFIRDVTINQAADGVYIEATKNQTAYERKRLLAKRRKFFRT